MRQLRYTLVTDGSSDVVLLHHLNWLLRQHTQCALLPQWAELRRLPRPPSNLRQRIEVSLDLYPCDLLFVHRDAERGSHEARVAEIHEAIHTLVVPPTVCVVPVRMVEAWLLFDEAALRAAVGNPHGQRLLDLPPIEGIERLADPKDTLYRLLRDASEFGARRLKRFPVERVIHRLAECLEDFSPLRQLSAFQALEADIRQVVAKIGL